MTNPMNRRAALSSLAAAGALFGASTVAKGAISGGGAKETVTLEQLAAMEFEPWSEEGEGFQLPSPETWRELTTKAYSTLTMAYNLMLKTKGDLVEIARELDEQDLLAKMSPNFVRTEQGLSSCAHVIQLADIRLMCAAAAYLKRDRPEEFADADM